MKITPVESSMELDPVLPLGVLLARCVAEEDLERSRIFGVESIGRMWISIENVRYIHLFTQLVEKKHHPFSQRKDMAKI